MKQIDKVRQVAGGNLVEPWTEREWCRTREKAEEKPEMEVRVQPETWRTMEADPRPKPATNCTMEGGTSQIPT